MTEKKMSSGIFFGIVIFLSVFCLYRIAISQPQQSPVLSELKQQTESTEQLWSLVRSLRKLRADYYENQGRHADKMQELRDTSAKLKAEVEELRRRENRIDKSLSEIESDIRKLRFENKENKLTELSTAQKLKQFISRQTEEIEKGIPYRKNDRLTRLKGSTQAEEPPSQEPIVTDLFGRVWNFSQEEMRIARSGETFTGLVEVGENRMQYARVFRVGHQVLGYLTEQDDQAGIWMDGIGWEKVTKDKAQSVREAVMILDRKRVPKYVQLPVKTEPVDIKTEVKKKQ